MDFTGMEFDITTGCAVLERTPHTLRQLLGVAHDLGHVAQIARVMAKQYRGAVGPWRAYLPIMDR
jgi:hypothetical protein